MYIQKREANFVMHGYHQTSGAYNMYVVVSLYYHRNSPKTLDVVTQNVNHVDVLLPSYITYSTRHTRVKFVYSQTRL